MDSIKNYPWAGAIEVSKGAFEKWRNSPQQTGFAFWALQNKAISRRKYFDWAINYYQTPFLEDRFFEQYTIKKKEWKNLKDLFQWTPEVLPVAVFNDLIFVGCVDPQMFKDRLPFKNRLLLTSDHTLQINWNFTQELSRMVDNKMDITQITRTKVALKEGAQAKKAAESAAQKTQAELKIVPLSEAQQPARPLAKPSLTVSAPKPTAEQQLIVSSFQQEANSPARQASTIPAQGQPSKQASAVSAQGQPPKPAVAVSALEQPSKPASEINNQGSTAKNSSKSSLQAETGMTALDGLTKSSPHVEKKADTPKLANRQNPQPDGQKTQAGLKIVPLSKAQKPAKPLAKPSLTVSAPKPTAEQQLIVSSFQQEANSPARQASTIPAQGQPPKPALAVSAPQQLAQAPTISAPQQPPKPALAVSVSQQPTHQAPAEPNLENNNPHVKEKGQGDHKASSQKDSSSASSAKPVESNKVESNKFELEDLPEATHSISLKEESYNHLWPKIKPFFCGSLILEIEENKIYPLSWTGMITIEDKKNNLLDLKARSFFTVIQRGRPYHGAVTDISTNKGFFKKVGWDSYPKHISALPIYKEKGSLKHIFIGCSPKTLSKKDIQAIEGIVNNYSPSKRLSQQAS